MQKSVVSLIFITILLGGVISSVALAEEPTLTPEERIAQTLGLPTKAEMEECAKAIETKPTPEERVAQLMGLPTKEEMQECALALGISPFLLGLG